MRAVELTAQPAVSLRDRYTAADLDVLSAAENRRFVPAAGSDPAVELVLAWELLYRREPRLYARLARAERLHPSLLGWLPDGLERIVDVGAGSGRLTCELLGRAREVVAVEPAAALRQLLSQRLARLPRGARCRVVGGFFDELPLPDGCADAVMSCSAFTPESGHGGEAGLAEMERVCRPGGLIAIVWPNNLGWLAEHGYRHLSFDGDVFVEFASSEEAAELIAIFYPDAPAYARCSGRTRFRYEELGVNAPRDVAFKALAA